MMSRRASLATPQTSMTQRDRHGRDQDPAGHVAPFRPEAGEPPEDGPVGPGHRGGSLRSAGELGQREQAWVEGEQDHHRELEEHDGTRRPGLGEWGREPSLGRQYQRWLGPGYREAMAS